MKRFTRGAIAFSTLAVVLASAASAHAQGEATQVDASRGGVTISSGVNSLTIGARMQFRWTVDQRESSDTDLVGVGVGQADGVLSQFDVPRMRVILSGGAFRPWLKYLFQFDMSRTSGDGDSKIKDAVIEIRPVGRPYRLALGQFKAPFGLQQITSSGRQQFVERAITDAKFAPGREMGAMFSGSLASQRVGYDVGAFNGSGESVRQNDASHLWAVRLFVEPLGPYAPSEGSGDAGDASVIHVGVAVRGGKQIRGRTVQTAIEDADNQRAVDFEFVLKTPRLYSTVESFWMTDEQQNPVPGPDIRSRGVHAQFTAMLQPRTVEVGVRYALIDGDTDVESSNLSEWRAVSSYYWRGHNLKLQGDVGQLRYGSNFAGMSSRARAGLPGLGTRLVAGEPLSDFQTRVQLQLAF